MSALTMPCVSLSSGIFLPFPYSASYWKGSPCQWQIPKWSDQLASHGCGYRETLAEDRRVGKEEKPQSPRPSLSRVLSGEWQSLLCDSNYPRGCDFCPRPLPFHLPPLSLIAFLLWPIFVLPSFLVSLVKLLETPCFSDKILTDKALIIYHTGFAKML